MDGTRDGGQWNGKGRGWGVASTSKQDGSIDWEIC